MKSVMSFVFAATLQIGGLIAADHPAPKQLEFPRAESCLKIPGELVSVDFIHRSGQYRIKSGELADFSMLPYGHIRYLNSEADLRDVPLGALYEFTLIRNSRGDFTRLVCMSDQPSDPAAIKTESPASEVQRKKFLDFNKKRGLPGWIDKTEGNFVTVTLFSGDQQNFAKDYLADFAVGKDVSLVVANDELRTWNPPTDKEKATVIAVSQDPPTGLGSSGVQLLVKVSYMLEGFRRGRVIRVFGTGWPLKDMPYGESLMGYGYGKLLNTEIIENTAKEYPALFPYRTNYGNEHLPWFKLKPGEAPPQYSERVVHAELVKADADKRTAQVRIDRENKLLDISLVPGGTVKHLGADATLAEIPPGTRCRLDLFQNDQGEFTLARLIQDDFSFFAANTISFRIENINLAGGKLQVARQLPEVKNYNGDMEKPQDIGRCILLVSAATRLWKVNQPAKLEDLKPNDSLLVNLSGEHAGPDPVPSHCTDIWVGEDAHKFATETQRAKHAPPQKKKP